MLLIRKMTMIIGLLMGGACLIMSTQAAPVPRAPKYLTKELLEGEWLFEWDNWPGGFIVFDEHGRYTGQHDWKKSRNWWIRGTWEVRDGDTIILFESNGYGCTAFSCKFDISKGFSPVLRGKWLRSNRTDIENPDVVLRLLSKEDSIYYNLPKHHQKEDEENAIKEELNRRLVDKIIRKWKFFD